MEWRDPVLFVVAVAVPTIAVITALVIWGLRGRQSEFDRGFREGYQGGVCDGYNRFARLCRDQDRRLN
jgi:hypothetical protein